MPDQSSESYNRAMQSITNLAAEYASLNAAIGGLELSLKEKNTRLSKITDQFLPDLLHEVGYVDMRLADGRRLELKSGVRASIPSMSAILKTKDILEAQAKSQRRERALEWLAEHGLGDLIKNELSTRFAAGDDEEAEALAAELTTRGIQVELEKTVNTGTLCAQLKELLQQGETVPLEDFGAYVFETVVIK